MAEKKEKREFIVRFQKKEEETKAELFKNYTVKLTDNGHMIIDIDLTIDEFPLTKSGKKLLIASSHGFDTVEGTTLGLSMNVTAGLPK